jgi:hypothetical protein
MAGNGAGRGRFIVVRGCPLGTAQDRCEWHACGTASEDDPRILWRRWLRLDRRVRPVLGDHRLVGKSPEGLAAGGGTVELYRADLPAGGYRAISGRDLRFSDRRVSFPLLSVATGSGADLAWTERGSGPGAGASGTVYRPS